MCTLCADCTVECNCPRCPFRAGKMLGWPPQIQPCSVCGLDDDRLCKNAVCAVTEHFILRGEMFCQICVEATHATAFPRQQFGMYCKAHEAAHKSRS